MAKPPETKTKSLIKNPYFLLAAVLLVFALGFDGWMYAANRQPMAADRPDIPKVKSAELAASSTPVLDIAAYNKKILDIANEPALATSSASSTASLSAAGKSLTAAVPLWPVKTVYPNAGALLPFNRIVAYYGNLYSKNMGVLGEYPEDEMLARLSSEVSKWQAADPATPVIPALHYIAVVAQAGPGKTGKYISRMPDSEIDKVLAMAGKIHGLVFLDVQVGQSSVEAEVPLLEKYLKLPNVHLGIDPEFAMDNGRRPGTVIGTLDASDINFAANYLAQIAKANNLPPKILVVHRFTQGMVTNYQKITPLPEVQIVMDMDGFGSPAKKISTYKSFIYREPVQFTGFKLFYKNDTARGGMMTPDQILKLTPIPVYIQYQ